MRQDSNPSVSVVMGVFNGERMLHDTVESILSQDDVDCEFIIVNDGSTDNTGDVLRGYAERDSRIRVIDQDNQGLTKALVKGCSEARGTYIARQDAGDVSFPGRLFMQKKAMDVDHRISFVSCWTEHCGPFGELLYVAKGSGYAAHPVSVLHDDSELGLQDGPTSHPSVMFRNVFYRQVGGYRPEFYFGQDWDLWYRLAEVGMFQMINMPLYRSALLPGSISASHRINQERIGKLSREALSIRRKGLSDKAVLDRVVGIRPKENDVIPKARDAAWLYFIGECLRRNDDRRAAGYFKRSLSINPFYAKTWIRLMQYQAKRLWRF